MNPKSPSKKKPPSVEGQNPGEEDDSWAYQAAAWSFVLIFLLIGVPMWIKTTQVYRVNLPYSQITEDLTELHFKSKVNLVLVSTENHKDHQFGPEVQKHLTGEILN